MYGVFQTFPGERHTYGHEKNVGNHHHERDDEYGEPVFSDNGRGDHHTHGDEEYRSEEVFDRGHEFLDFLGLDRFGKYGTHHKGSECGGEAHGLGKGNHSETQAYAHDEQDLVVDVFPGALEQGRDEVYAHEEPEYQEEGQFPEVEEHLPTGELVGYGEGGEQHHKEYGNHILDYDGAEDHLGIRLAFQAHFVVGLYDDSGGRHREQTSEENAFHRGPGHGLAGEVAEEEDSQELAACSYQG